MFRWRFCSNTWPASINHTLGVARVCVQGDGKYNKLRTSTQAVFGLLERHIYVFFFRNCWPHSYSAPRIIFIAAGRSLSVLDDCRSLILAKLDFQPPLLQRHTATPATAECTQCQFSQRGALYLFFSSDVLLLSITIVNGL